MQDLNLFQYFPPQGLALLENQDIQHQKRLQL